MTLKYGSVSIGELLEEGVIHAIQDGNHGEKHPKTSDYVEDGIPFIMANSLNLGFVDLGSASKISEEQASSLRIGFAMTGDVLLTHKGTIGNTAIVPQVDPYIMLTPQVTYYRLDQSKLSNAYLLYCFRDLTFQKTIKSLAQQSTRPYIGITAQRNLKINFRDINEQIKIVNAIKPYDDLIENNRRRIQLLEESARLLYQEWFVHLRFPGHEQVKITDGVPEGWEKKNLTAIAEVNQSSLKKGFDERIEYIDISCVTTHSISDTTWYEFADAPGRARRMVKHCDILWSCVRPNRRSHVLVWEPHDQLIASTGFAVISATQVSPFFLYQSLTTNEYVGYLTNRAGGAAYPAVTSKVFEESFILVPSSKLVTQYHDQVQDTYAQINVLRSHSHKLAQARDLLLPKLMSGELAV